MMGLMLASMFSAAMSSLNSEFNVMAGVLTKDFYQRAPGFFVNERSRKILMNADGSLSDRGKNVMNHTPLQTFRRSG